MCYQVVRTLIPVTLYDLQLRSCWFEQFDHCPVNLFAEPQWNDAALYNLLNALNIFDNSPKPSRRTSPKGCSGNQQLRARKSTSIRLTIPANLHKAIEIKQKHQLLAWSLDLPCRIAFNLQRPTPSGEPIRDLQVCSPLPHAWLSSQII